MESLVNTTSSASNSTSGRTSCGQHSTVPMSKLTKMFGDGATVNLDNLMLEHVQRDAFQRDAI